MFSILVSSRRRCRRISPHNEAAKMGTLLPTWNSFRSFAATLMFFEPQAVMMSAVSNRMSASSDDLPEPWTAKMATF